MDRRSINLALAGSLAAALSLLAIAASAQDAAKEKCYGVALKGQTTAPPAPEPPVPAPVYGGICVRPGYTSCGNGLLCMDRLFG